MTRPTIALVMLHLIGNAALLLLGYYWLGLGESDVAHLIFSAAVVLFFALATLWLHGTSLVFFRDRSTLISACLRALRSTLPLFLFAILVLILYVGLQEISGSFGHQAFTIGSYSTMKLRRPVEPAKVLDVFHAFIWIVRWLIVPILAWPFAAEIANRGWSGFSLSAFHRSRNLYISMMQAGVMVLVAILLPWHLFFWIPKMSSFSLEALSFALRVGGGYLLFTFGLLAVEYFTASGKPWVTQPNTAVSP